MKKIAFFAAALLSLPALAADHLATIVIKDHKFEPAVLEVPADTRIKLTVDNQDPTAEEFESYDFNREKIIGGNKKALIFINPLEKGEYKFFGEFNPKTAQGKIVAK